MRISFAANLDPSDMLGMLHLNRHKIVLLLVRILAPSIYHAYHLPPRGTKFVTATVPCDPWVLWKKDQVGIK